VIHGIEKPLPGKKVCESGNPAASCARPVGNEHLTFFSQKAGHLHIVVVSDTAVEKCYGKALVGHGFDIFFFGVDEARAKNQIEVCIDIENFLVKIDQRHFTTTARRSAIKGYLWFVQHVSLLPDFNFR